MRVWLSILACAGLVACGDGFPWDEFAEAEAGDVVANDIPEELSANLQSASYDATAQTLSLNLTGLDSGEANGAYTRTPSLDIGDYEAYTKQDDALDRHFTAYVRTANAATGGVVSDGGQFGIYYSGGFYDNNGVYSAPTGSGLVSYAGDYAGLSNLNDNGNALLPVTGVTNPATIPNQSARISGRILLNADFNDGIVNGSVFDRVRLSNGDNLPALILTDGQIAADGTFFGDTAVETQTPGSNGTFGGVFGGSGATSVAGVVQASGFYDDGQVAGGQEEEHGTFVLNKCGTAGDDPTLCANVNP